MVMGYPDAPNRAQGHKHPAGHKHPDEHKGMKAQAWSFDFMASVTVFFLVVITLFFVWEYTVYQNTEQMIFNEMENKALMTADMMIRTKGFPEQWNDSNVQLIGLADDENVLDETKMITFVGMDYENTKMILGIPSYEYFFQVVHLNGTQAQSQGTDLILGIDPTGLVNSSVVVPIERYVLFDHRVAKLRFMLWR